MKPITIELKVDPKVVAQIQQSMDQAVTEFNNAVPAAAENIGHQINEIIRNELTRRFNDE